MESSIVRSSDDHSRLVRSSVPCPKHKCPLCREERSLLRLNSARWVLSCSLQGSGDNLLSYRHSMTSVTGHTCNFSMSDDFIEIVDNGAESPNGADLRSDIFPMS